MATILNCPSCGRRCRVPSSVQGRRCRCPGCGAEITEAVTDLQATATVEIIPSATVTTGEAVAAPWIALAGSAVLLIGTFLPIIRVPIFGAVTSYVGDGRGDGIVVAVLAGLAACAALVRLYRGVWALGLLAVAVMSFTFIYLQLKLGELREEQAHLPMQTPFQLDWGWAVLAVGALVTVAAAATGEASRNRRNARLILGLAAASLILTSAITAGLTWGIPTAIDAYRAAERRASREAAEQTARETAQRAAEEARQREAARIAAEREADRQAAEREVAKRNVLRDKTQQEAIALGERGRKLGQPHANEVADAALFKVQQGALSVAVTGLALDGQSGLMVELLVENGAAKAVSFRPWGGGDGDDTAELIDSKGQHFRRRSSGQAAQPVLLRPGNRFEDRINFPGVTTDEAEYLVLELPAGAFSGYGKFRLRIPRSMLVLKTAASRGRAALSGLVSLLDDPAPDVRIDALTDIALLGQAARPRVDAVANRLADAERQVQQAAAAALLAMEPFGRDDVPRLKGLLERRQAEVREFAVRTLCGMGTQAAGALSELIAALKDENETIRFTAASALGQFGAESSDVAPALIKALNDGNRTVGLAALRSLVALPPDADTADVLVKTLRHTDETVAAAASAAVGRYARVGKQHVPALIEALRRGPESIRAGVVTALRRIGGMQRMPSLPS